MPFHFVLRRGARLSLALLVLAFSAAGSVAQYVPYRERPTAYDRNARGERGDQAGAFDYYLLALSWSPTYCAGLSPGRRDPQCDGRPYAFVLHGLWPQHERGWPQDCRSADRGWVPAPRRRAHARHHAEQDAWCFTSTASTAPAPASASTATSTWRASSTRR